ncbi:unnamed protein product [Caenorhabditis brenneri]
MLPGSLNLPVRRREEKGRRIEGKSQNHRGTTKSKIVPTSVALPSKTPSPATTPSTHIPPPVMIPPVTTVPLPMSNVLKDPTSMSPNLGGREAKVIKRKIKEPETKPPPPPSKATIRKKKSSASEAKSISIDGKTSSEHEAGGVLSNKGKKKKRSHTSTDSGRKLNDKSEGSKEPSSNDERTPKRFNKEMAHSYFKQMIESQKSKKRTDDARLEVMPESSQINVSARSLKKKHKKGPKKEPAPDTDFFKPNGDPVWMVPERPAGECEKNEDGTPIKNPDLALALAEDDLEIDEKNWLQLINSFMEMTLLPGKGMPEGYIFDPMDPIEKLEQLNAVFEVNPETPLIDTVTYNTIKNLVDLSEIAMKRFQLKQSGLDVPERPLPTPPPPAASAPPPPGSLKPSENSTSLPNMPPKATVSTELFQLNTCLQQSGISFDLKRCVSIKYDRQHPRASIKKFRKRLSYSMEQTTQMESKEKT